MSKPSLSALLERLNAAEAQRPISSNPSKEGRQDIAPQRAVPPSAEPSPAVPMSGDVGAGRDNRPAPALTPGSLSRDSGTQAVGRTPDTPASLLPGPDAPATQALGEAAGGVTRPAESPEEIKTRLQRLKIQRFVTVLLSPECNHNATQAYLRTYASADCTVESAAANASRLLSNAEVLAEMKRQLTGIEAHADLDEDYVYRHWRAIAESDVFSVFKFDATMRCVGFHVHPDEMTKEQRLAIREITFDRDGRVKGVKLVDREKAVELIAKARKMFTPETESGTAITDMAKMLRERLAAAYKRTGRVFDGLTGEQVG